MILNNSCNNDPMYCCNKINETIITNIILLLLIEIYFLKNL